MAESASRTDLSITRLIHIPGPIALFPKFVQLGLLPQMIFWVVYTIIIGALVGSVTAGSYDALGQNGGIERPFFPLDPRMGTPSSLLGND
jgi:hypothetical protein